ncbi:MAG: PqiC family protein [Maricaulaceae bacterium]
MKNLKINPRKTSSFKLLALSALATLSACASSPDAQLHLLKSANGALISQTSSHVSVRVGPIVMPEHLKRSEIVFRSGAYDVNLNEYERWAESLERNMISVITSDLAAHLGTEKAFDYYANFTITPDYIVKLNVTEFGRVSPDTVSLSASWELSGKSSLQNKLYSENIKTTIKYSEDNEDDKNINNVIAAMNEALNELSLKIANQIAGKNSQS